MCTISGCVVFKEPLSYSSCHSINRRLREIIFKGAQRGRDSYGVVSFSEHWVKSVTRTLGPPDHDSNGPMLFTSVTKVVLINNRAEPTTEFVAKKTGEDIQPFNDDGTWVVHNGTIANDRELEGKFDLGRRTRIDTAILPPLLTKLWDGTAEGLLSILQQEVVGSYALAVYREGSDKVFLAANYKPLSLAYDFEHEVLYFSSLESFITPTSVQSVVSTAERAMEVPPYTLLEIDINTKQIREFSLVKPSLHSRPSSIVIASSGLDSTVSACWALKQGHEVELVHFNYGCRATRRELRAIKEIASYLDVPLTIIPLDVFKNVIKHSRLTDDGGELVKDRQGEASAELAHEWVPARNLIFMSIAAGYAEAHKFDHIILGGNLEESGAYADNELIFQTKFDRLLPHALNLDNHVSVLTPVANMMKRDIVELGLELGAPLLLTWSCYEDRETPCNSCGPDYMRRVAFKMLGYVDPQATDTRSEFWAGCKQIKLVNGTWEV